jgi:hypothetical protein
MYGLRETNSGLKSRFLQEALFLDGTKSRDGLPATPLTYSAK